MNTEYDSRIRPQIEREMKELQVPDIDLKKFNKNQASIGLQMKMLT